MPATEKELLASGMAKLAKTQHAISIPCHKYTIPSLKEEAARLKRAMTQGEEVLVQGKLNLPAWMPSFLAKGLRWVAGPFLKASIGSRLLDQGLGKAKLSELKEHIRKMDGEFIEGILTPLTLADEAECNAYYYKTLRHLESVLPIESTPEGQRARQEAVNFTTNHYALAKRVECALKGSDGKNRALTAEQAHALDPRLCAEIMAEYEVAFVLSEDERGK